jgi:hypothetical protein
MHLALRFWLHTAVWTGLILALLLAISLATGMGTESFRTLPIWLGLALTLAPFPAGIAASKLVFPADRLSLRNGFTVAAAAAVVAVVLFLVGNFVAPRFVTASEVGDPSAMTLGQLHTAAKEAAAESGRVATPTAGDWYQTNRLAWHFVRRTDGAVLPIMFGLLGLLVGYWSTRTRRREWQQAQQWAMGLFLLMSTYLAGENSYELIVVRAAGPVYFAGDFVLIVPSLLLIGLGWATVVETAGRRA